MSILAEARASQILLIDPVLRRKGVLNDRMRLRAERQYADLSTGCNCAGVPRYYAVSAQEAPDEHWFSRPCEMNKQLLFECEPSKSVWKNGYLLDAMRAEMREQLFICGFWLDDVVSSAALEALAIGFDTHIIMDLSPAMDRVSHQATLDRLNQYGVPPISLRSLLYEWMANSEDSATRQALAVLWEKQVAIDNTGASA